MVPQINEQDTYCCLLKHSWNKKTLDVGWLPPSALAGYNMFHFSNLVENWFFRRKVPCIVGWPLIRHPWPTYSVVLHLLVGLSFLSRTTNARPVYAKARPVHLTVLACIFYSGLARLSLDNDLHLFSLHIHPCILQENRNGFYVSHVRTQKNI